MKDQGVTAEFVKAVHTAEHRRNPVEYNVISDMEDEVVAYDQEQDKILREQRQEQLTLQRLAVKVDISDKDIEI